MANVGVFATDQEYAVMIPGFKQVGDFGVGVDRASLIIRCVEASLRREINIPLSDQVIVGEEHTMAWPTFQDGMLIRRQTSFMLRGSPVKTFSGLRIALTRSDVDGSVLTSSTIPRASYHVDMQSGVVQELEGTLMQGFLLTIWPDFGFPSGTMALLADYTTSVPESDIGLQAKMVCFMAVARIWNEFEKNRFGVTSSSFNGVSTSYLNVQWTPEEMGYLKGMKRPVFPSNY